MFLACGSRIRGPVLELSADATALSLGCVCVCVRPLAHGVCAALREWCPHAECEALHQTVPFGELTGVRSLMVSEGSQDISFYEDSDISGLLFNPKKLPEEEPGENTSRGLPPDKITQKSKDR